MINDRGSFVDIFYMETFVLMELRDNLSPCIESIYELTSITTLIVGVIDLNTSIGSKKGTVRQTCCFIVVEVNSIFNSILGLSFAQEIKADPSSNNQCLQYLSHRIIAIIKGLQPES